MHPHLLQDLCRSEEESCVDFPLHVWPRALPSICIRVEDCCILRIDANHLQTLPPISCMLTALRTRQPFASFDVQRSHFSQLSYLVKRRASCFTIYTVKSMFSLVKLVKVVSW